MRMGELPFELVGTVVPGKQLGSRLGFPTANIAYDPCDRLWPREGVYVGIAQLDGDERSYLSILNQGSHPTAPGGAPTVEAHLLGFPAKALYGCRLKLSYRAFLRPETRFSSLDGLRAQLAADRESAVLWAQANAPGLISPIDPQGAKDGTL